MAVAIQNEQLWQEPSTNSRRFAKLNPSGHIVLAAFNGSDIGLYVSTDNGATFVSRLFIAASVPAGPLTAVSLGLAAGETVDELYVGAVIGDATSNHAHIMKFGYNAATSQFTYINALSQVMNYPGHPQQTASVALDGTYVYLATRHSTGEGAYLYATRGAAGALMNGLTVKAPVGPRTDVSPLLLQGSDGAAWLVLKENNGGAPAITTGGLVGGTTPTFQLLSGTDGFCSSADIGSNPRTFYMAGINGTQRTLAKWDAAAPGQSATSYTLPFAASEDIQLVIDRASGMIHTLFCATDGAGKSIFRASAPLAQDGAQPTWSDPVRIAGDGVGQFTTPRAAPFLAAGKLVFTYFSASSLNAATADPQLATTDCIPTVRKARSTTLARTDTRRLISASAPPVQTDVSRLVAADVVAASDTQRTVFPVVVKVMDTQRVTAAGAQASADTMRQVSEEVLMAAADAVRVVGDLTIVAADTLRTTDNYVVTVNAETRRTVAVRMDLLPDTVRKVAGSLPINVDTLRTLYPEVAVFADTARLVGSPTLTAADTVRALARFVQFGGDTARTTAVVSDTVMVVLADTRRTVLGVDDLKGGTGLFGIGLQNLKDLFTTIVLRVAPQASTALYADTGSVDGVTAISLGVVQCSQVLVQNSAASPGVLLVGSATAQTFELAPGADLLIGCDSLAKVYVKAKNAADQVQYNYLARS